MRTRTLILRFFVLFFSIHFCVGSIYAIVPHNIWYKSDSLIHIPVKDTIPWTDEYTLFSVLRGDTSQCLWSFTEDDTIVSAVLSGAFYNSTTGLVRTNSPFDFSQWRIYSYHSGIRLDSTKRLSLCLGEQIVFLTDSSDIKVDTLTANIELEELAYYAGSLSKQQQNIFQTYLALKYGVTLDHAPYLSAGGDTLWHPKREEDYYHRIIGIGSDTINDWYRVSSTSKEDVVLFLNTDTLYAGEYILMGDDGGSLACSSSFDSIAYIDRKWLIRQFVNTPRPISLSLNTSTIDYANDSVSLVIVDANNFPTQTIFADSIIGDTLYYYTFSVQDSISYLRINGCVTDKNKQKRVQNHNASSATNTSAIHFDAQTNSIHIEGFSKNQEFNLFLYDSAGKFLSSLHSTNPIDLSQFSKGTIFYVEIVANGEIIDSFAIPIKQ